MMEDRPPLHSQELGQLQPADAADVVNFEPINTAEYIQKYDRLLQENLKAHTQEEKQRENEQRPGVKITNAP